MASPRNIQGFKPDKNLLVEAYINNQRVDKFLSYDIDAQMFLASDAFSFQFVPYPGLSISAGHEIAVWINGMLECSGIIDSKEISVSKEEGRVWTIKGRDYVGYMSDACIYDPAAENGLQVWGDNQDSAETMEALFIRITNGSKTGVSLYLAPMQVDKYGLYSTEGAAKSIAITGQDYNSNDINLRIIPGHKIFEVMRTAAQSRGFLLWSDGKGNLVIGTPKQVGEPKFNIYPGQYINCQITDDLAMRYARVAVIGKIDNTDVEAVASDSTFPIQGKSLVISEMPEGSGVNAKQWATLCLKKQIYEGWTAHYEVPGLAQNGSNFAINEICAINDPDNDVQGSFLVTGRRFSLTKENGSTTALRLSKLGVYPS